MLLKAAQVVAGLAGQVVIGLAERVEVLDTLLLERSQFGLNSSVLLPQFFQARIRFGHPLVQAGHGLIVGVLGVTGRFGELLGDLLVMLVELLGELVQGFFELTDLVFRLLDLAVNFFGDRRDVLTGGFQAVFPFRQVLLGLLVGCIERGFQRIEQVFQLGATGFQVLALMFNRGQIAHFQRGVDDLDDFGDVAA